MSGRETRSGKSGKDPSKGKKANAVEVVDSGKVSITVTGVPEEVSATSQTIDGRTCKSCNGPDSDEMVQCDKCDKWHHFGCVGVTEEVADHSWRCPTCVAAKWIQRSGSTSSKQLQTTGGAKSNTNIQDPKTSKEPNENDQQSSESKVDRTPKSNTQEPKKSDNMEQQPSGGKQADVESSVVSSSSSRRSSRALLKLQLQKLVDEERLAKEFLERKYALLEKAASEQSFRSSSSSMSRVRDWIHDNNTNHGEGGMLNPDADFFEPVRHSTQNPRTLAEAGVSREQSISSRQGQLTTGRTFSIIAASNGVARPVCSAVDDRQRSEADKAVHSSMQGQHNFQYVPERIPPQGQYSRREIRERL